MIVERGVRSSEPVARPENGADRSAAASAEQLELRVRRLEEAVAGLQDTRPMEERIVERVTEKVAQATSPGSQESSSLIMEAGRQLLPGTLGLASSSRAFPENEAAAPGSSSRRGWWFFEAYDDLRAMIRMFSDRRYRPHMTWTAFLTPFFLVACIFAVWLLMPTSLPLVGPLLRVLDKLVDLVLAFFAYKILLREVRRYREMLPT
jgi:hypothetical protein